MNEDELLENRLKRLPGMAPSLDAQDRILARCAQEQAKRVSAMPRFRFQWRWALATAGLLLLLNSFEAERHSAEINRITLGQSQVAASAASIERSPSAVASLRSRRVQVAALLRDSETF